LYDVQCRFTNGDIKSMVMSPVNRFEAGNTIVVYTRENDDLVTCWLEPKAELVNEA
jgi:hypothetical protein